MELLKYIYALKPGHKYFSKDFDGEDEWRSDGSYSSEDSEFELQFSEVVKDLPPSLASKLPKRKVRDYDEYDDDEEKAKQEVIVQKNTKKSILRENTVIFQRDSSHKGNEHLYLQQIALLEKQIEMLLDIKAKALP